LARIEGWTDHADPADQSDYARACRVTIWLGSIVCRGGVAVVLSGDVGDVAWYADDQDDRGFLVQWIAVNDERLIGPALKAPTLRSDPESVDTVRPVVIRIAGSPSPKRPMLRMTAMPSSKLSLSRVSEAM
jgi:hypothetical protein